MRFPAACWPYLRAAAALLLLALVGACGGDGQRSTLGGATMGTTWSVIYAGRDGVPPAPALQSAIEVELLAINDALSTYLADSELSRLNSAPSATDTIVSERLATVLDRALAITAATGGAYDVTVGPLVDLWGFGSAETEESVPSRAAITAALASVGAGLIDWNASTRRLRKPAGVRVDLSSIAKGYAVDRVAMLLRDAGVRDFLVEIGGELRGAGERPGGGPWRLAIESPRPVGSRAIGAISIHAAAVATSGDYRNYFEVDGQRYSHLVDPRSGYPVAHDLVSVTVVDDDCMSADAWATALLVLGREAALTLARERGLAAYLVARDGDGLAVEYTDQFAEYLATGPDAPGA